MNKTNVVIVLSLLVLLLTCVQVYRLFYHLPTSTTHQSSVRAITANVKSSVAQLTKPIIDQPIVTSPILLAPPRLTCEGFNRANQNYDMRYKMFVSEIAENSFYDGIDKAVILDTLMAEFGIETAINFIRALDHSSPQHEYFKAYKQRLDSLKIHGKHIEIEANSPLNMSWRKDYNSINGSLIERANFTINRLPSYARVIWTHTANTAAIENDFTSFQHSILQLAKRDYPPLEHAFLLNDLAGALLRSSFTPQQKQQVIDDLSAINETTFYVTLGDRQDTTWIDELDIRRLGKFGVDLRAINFVNVATVTVSSDKQLLDTWQASIHKYNQHHPKPEAESWCKENKPEAPIYSVTQVSLSAMLAQDDYHTFGEFLEQCYTLNDVMEANYFINAQGWDMSKVFSLEEMEKSSFKERAKIIKNGLPENYKHVFNFSSGNSTGHRENRNKQLSLLIKHGLYPKDPSIAFALHRLTLSDSLSILKQAGDIDTTGKYGVTLVFNAVLSGNNKLATTLINDGYPLTLSTKSPDPLLAYLNRLRANKREFDSQFLELLMVNTPQITQWHINAVHYLKLNDFEFVDAIIEAYPELYSQPPDTLLTIDCDGQRIEFG